MSKRTREFECNKDPDMFCFMCGQYTIIRRRRVFSDHIKTLYSKYFGIEPKNAEKPWTPNTLCTSCRVELIQWESGQQTKFDTPMIWREPTCHSIECYICQTKVLGVGRSRGVTYASVPTVTLPVLHSTAVADPVPLSTVTSECGGSSCTEFRMENERNVLSQAQLNDWIRDLELSKEKAEIHTSRMQQFKFVSSDVKVTYSRTRHEPFSKHYTKKDSICYCNDIPGLFKEFGQTYDSKEWRLFIDGNKLSLKAVLLHIGNKKPSIPIAHAVNTKETYEEMQKILKFIKYEEHDWKICSDLKVVAMLCGLQSGYTKHCCFLCKWDSRARKDHYVRKDWPERVEFTVGVDNIKYTPLVKKEKIILPPLHIKLGLIKNFVKALDKEGEAFDYLKTVFPDISQAKIKEGIFVGPQIRKLINNNQ
ncbi:PREDICTED: uncharacterized protein LOC108378862 [Rhagoletis zephyria]|uniref:uncharacterized protein LOC108359039 n=1 Tax=Rhagoletis zephyria TaxID=28612 RepID=UPI0008112F09|nr:PREDICTED: uncharacterized protein LOC108359039 [Rhagoletis zephyria]XP_017466468.1 PREDICTED: uncharacterized protein LOC108359227 [Rhagoletis zephyria]XP_017466892.1 PREDICTED: uncharacterized protein LOC108359505 [Rhagoletis zephyria]XP_017466903.1 PREDICTED: uncharacterized protein LOC108359513 [Rhagoletis zephyria]XP_017467206.1 PREDICTED: uncharacterized protein LOC108359746 [Rhagoletis zephyria]XP_017467964.1 PREDICTED: uncharacterized protein LOC108360266 [Rhagoletis zephyria]XP_01